MDGLHEMIDRLCFEVGIPPAGPETEKKEAAAARQQGLRERRDSEA